MTRYNPRTGQPETYQAGPYDAPHWYLQVGGKLSGGVEEWSNGFRMAITPGQVVVVDNTAVTALKTAFQTFYASSIISAGTTLAYMKYNPIDVDGHYPTGSSNQYLYANGIGGTGSQSDKPFQDTIAVTWTTDVSRGLAHEGRFYLPMPALATTAGAGAITTAAADSVKAAASTLLTSLNAAVPNLHLAVFSRKAGAPTHRSITGVRVGLIWDTQRRRRKKLLEQYR